MEGESVLLTQIPAVFVSHYKEGKEQAGLFVLKNEPQNGVGGGVGGGAEGPGEAACLH